MHAQGQWEEKYREAVGIREIRDAQRDKEDGLEPEEGINNTFNDKDMKETNAARKMNQLLNIYKISHSFKRYVLAKGGDTWDFVFNNYISKGMGTLVDARSMHRTSRCRKPELELAPKHGEHEDTRSNQIPYSDDQPKIHIQMVHRPRNRCMEDS